MGLRRQIVVWRDQLVSGRVAVRVLGRAERRVKLASLALRRARRRSERVLDAGLRRAQTQVPRVVAAVRVQAKTWRQRSSRVAARWGAAVAASARNTRLREGPLAPLAKAAGEWVGSIRRRESTQGGRYRIEVATPLSRHIGVAGAGLTVVLVALPAFAGRDLLNDLIFVLTMLALAQYWNLLAGYAGLVSVGQQAFVGLGGYLLFALTLHAGLDPLVAILLAGLLAGALALPTALVVFRLSGAYFAIGTWVMAEVYRLVFAQFKQLGGGTGTSLPPFVTNEVAGVQWVKVLLGVRTPAARDIITYWVALAFAVGTILLVYLILRSRHGLALAAIRDSEVAAESVGVDNFRTKLWVYMVTAAATGMVGALVYLQKAL